MSRYRSVFSGFGIRPWTPAVKILILSCVIAYFVQIIDYRSGGPSFTSKFGLTPVLVTHSFYLWQLVTYIFLHAVGQPLHSLGFGSFPSIQPMTSTPFGTGQPGYVM